MKYLFPSLPFLSLSPLISSFCFSSHLISATFFSPLLSHMLIPTSDLIFHCGSLSLFLLPTNWYSQHLEQCLADSKHSIDKRSMKEQHSSSLVSSCWNHASQIASFICHNSVDHSISAFLFIVYFKNRNMNTFLLFIKVSLKLFFLRYFPTPVLRARCTGKTWSANKSVGWWSSVDINTIYRDGAENIAMMNFCVCSCLASTRGKHRAAATPYFLNMVFSSFVELLNCDLCNKLLLVGKKSSVEFN